MCPGHVNQLTAMLAPTLSAVLKASKFVPECVEVSGAAGLPAGHELFPHG